MNPAGTATGLRWQICVPWLAFATITLSATRTDPDLWGHVRFGLDWLQTHSLPWTDQYSFTQDRPWVNHEWLSEAIMAAAYRAAGSAGLVLLKLAIVACALAVLARRLRGSTPVVMAGFLTVAIVGGLPLTGTIRPQVWSVLGLSLVMPLLDDRPPGLRRMAASALLFAAWANLHGGWITGGAALAVHVVIRLVHDPRHAFSWIALSVVSLAATLVNPYGAGLWQFLATTVRASRPDIGEWQPFSLHEPPIMWVSVLAPLIVAAFLTRRRDARPSVEAWAVLLLLIMAGLKVSRVAPLTAIASLVLLAPYIRHAWGNRLRVTAPTQSVALVFGAPAILAIAAAWAPTARVMECLPINDRWAPDRTAASQLVGRSGKLWTTFDWGEYAIWHFGPALRVSIDGRRETVYSDEIIRWHRAVEVAEPDALEKLVRIAPDYVWLRAERLKTREWLNANGYRIDVNTPMSFVAVRQDLPPLADAERSLLPCFP